MPPVGTQAFHEIHEVPQLMRASAFSRLLANPTGEILYVDSARGSDDYTGHNVKAPTRTLARALVIANAGAGGSNILIAPGHTEIAAVANALLISKPDISVIGLGNAVRRPRITFSGNVAADVQVNAAGLIMRNLRFVNGIDSLAAMFTVAAADCLFEDIAVESSLAFRAIVAFEFAAAADRFAIRRLSARQLSVVSEAVQLACIRLADCDDFLIEDCNIIGHYATSCILNTVASLNTHTIKSFLNNLRTVAPTTGACISYAAGTTGWIADMRLGRAIDGVTVASVITSDGTRKANINIHDIVVANEVASVSGQVAVAAVSAS